MNGPVFKKPQAGWRRRETAAAPPAGANAPAPPPPRGRAPQAPAEAVADTSGDNAATASAPPLMRPRASAAPAGSAFLRPDTSGRFAIVAVGFAVMFVVLAGRALYLAGAPQAGADGVIRSAVAVASAEAPRGDLVDRRGDILATTLEAYSLFADPRQVWDPVGTAAALARTVSGIEETALAERLSGSGRFVWVRRGLSPRAREAVLALGLPGLDFRREPKRVYPRGRLAAHVLGFTDVDGIGAAGAERAFHRTLAAGTPVALSLDLRVQFALEDVLRADMARYAAAGAVGLVTNVNTGEILALASLPDFDPNAPGRAAADAQFNRAVTGAYELGSVFKVFTYAMAFDRGAVTATDVIDARTPVVAGAVDVRDPAPSPRDVTVREAFIRSSNVAAARLGVETPPQDMTRYWEDFGLLSPPPLELGGAASPLTPERWDEAARATIAFGHGLAVSPVAFAAAFGAAVNGGVYLSPSLIPARARRLAPRRVIGADASAVMTSMLREAVLHGTGRRAEAEGFEVGGKTGTAEQAIAGGYDETHVMASFAAVFPADAPRYAVIVMFDRPSRSSLDGAPGVVSAAITAAPSAGRVVGRVAPLLGVPARRDPQAVAAARARLAARLERGTGP